MRSQYTCIESDQPAAVVPAVVYWRTDEKGQVIDSWPKTIKIAHDESSAGCVCEMPPDRPSWVPRHK